MIPSRVFLIDDHELVLDAISNLISSSGVKTGIRVIGVAKSFEIASAALENQQPDLLLLDINMPGVNGYEIAYLFKKKWPAMKILMLSSNEGISDVTRSRDAGADGFALKGGSHEELIEAILSVLKGDQEFVVSKALIDESEGADLSNMGLTRRERQVLRLLVHGESAKGIGNILKISSRTAEKHRAKVVSKLKAPNAIQMVEYANQLGLPCN